MDDGSIDHHLCYERVRDGNRSLGLDKSRADALTTGRLDFDGTGSGAMSNGSSRREVEEVAAFCEMTNGCRKELLYSHFNFHFDASQCIRNCNCGVPLEAASESWHNEEINTEHQKKVVDDDADEGIPKGCPRGATCVRRRNGKYARRWVNEGLSILPAVFH
uniref:ATP-dependent DNA helicase RecQ zinc-binding domain-containing protein n=1 Tax=Hyaloperonospora arabidopsidis (strain Emoy2) TaxID=559515 RepID=M4BMT7_HYAAE